jgi:8-oxo-dGTP diphosphatase
VLEETGVVVEPGAVTGVYQNMARDIISLVFRVVALSGSATPSSESMAVSWLSAKEVENLLDDAYAVRLLDALAEQAPVSRPHDGTAVLDT